MINGRALGRKVRRQLGLLGVVVAIGTAPGITAVSPAQGLFLPKRHGVASSALTVGQPRPKPLDGLISRSGPVELKAHDQPVLANSETADDQLATANTLFRRGIQQFQTNQFQAALQSWQRALALYQTLGERQGEAGALGNLGLVYYSLGQYGQAIEYHQQALAIDRDLGNRQGEADDLGNLGLVYDALGEYQRAIEFHQQALTIRREIGDRQGETNSLDNLGLIYRTLGQHQQALALHEQSLAIKRDIGDTWGEANSLINLGLAYSALAQYQRAIDANQQALAVYRTIGDRRGEANALNNLGLVYSSLSQYQQALELYQQALAIRREINDVGGQASSLGSLGLAYDALGEYQQAIAFHQQALAIVRELSDRRGEAAVIGSLANTYYSLGEYQQAIAFYQQALDIFDAIGDRWGAATVLGGLGTVYSALGQYQRAIEFHQQTLETARNLDDHRSEANALDQLGRSYYALRDYWQAIEFYQQALVIRRDIGNRQGEASALGGLGITYRALGQYQRAIEFHQQALGIDRDIGDRQGEAASLVNLGLAYDALGQYQQAIEFHQQSLTLANDISDRRGAAVALNNLGLALLNAEQFAEAEIALTQSIDAFESLRTDLSDTQRIAIADTQLSAYLLLEQALVSQNKPGEALAIAEQSRAQAFALQLAVRQDDFATATPASAPSVADIQRIAREQNVTLVEYSFLQNRGLYIWVVQPDGEIQFRSVAFEDTGDGAIAANPITTLDGPIYRNNIAPSELDTLVADSRRGLGVVNSSARESNIEQLNALHQVLIDPIADLLPPDPDANVVFIPQGSLFLVPFAALQAGDGTHLIEHHTILTAPSIQVFDLAARAASGQRRETALPHDGALVVGNPVMPEVWIPGDSGLEEIQLAPLPGAEVEAVAIGEFLGVAPLIGAQATEAQIKQQLPDAPLIHFATHGLLEYGNPQSSGILDIPGAVAFTPGDGEDGLLTATEILDMDLQAQLAILSACDTGRGRITGDGVVGLSRSLITAGVPSVIVSLWAVPDSPTAALMTEFYRQLQQGHTKAQALRQAMLTTMQQYPEPQNWAAFTLTGKAE